MTSPRGPRVFYGWILVSVSFFSVAIGFISVTIFSLLIVALQKEYGWSSTSILGSYALQSVVWGLTAPFGGKLVDRFGARVMIPIGALLLGGGTAAVGFSSSLWQVYLFYGLVAGVGMPFVTALGHTTVLQHWFVRKRGLALGLVSAGGGLGWMVLAPVFQYVISTQGWRFACQILGVMIMLVVIPLNLIFQRQRPQDMGLLPDNGVTVVRHEAGSLIVDPVWARREWTLPAALRTWRLWVVFAGMWSSMFVHDSVKPLEASMLVGAGYEPVLVATMLGVGSGVMAAGRILWGGISDRISREAAFLLGGLCFLIGVLLLLVIQSGDFPYLIYVYAIFLGLGIGVIGPVSAAIAADLFQGPHFGSVYGFVAMAFGMGGLVGSLASGYLSDVTGSYHAVLVVDAVMVCVMSTLFWLSSPSRIRLVPGRARQVVPECVEQGAGSSEVR